MWVDVDFSSLSADAPLALDHLCREPPPPISAPGAAWPPPPSTTRSAGGGEGSAAEWWGAWVSRMLCVGGEQERSKDSLRLDDARSRVYLTIGDRAVKLGQPREGAPTPSDGLGGGASLPPPIVSASAVASFVARLPPASLATGCVRPFVCGAQVARARTDG